MSEYQPKRQPSWQPEPKQMVAVQTCGWIRATGRYIVHDRDFVLMKLGGILFAILFGLDATASIAELPLLWLLPDDIAESVTVVVMIVLWLVAFRLFKVRKKVSYYRYTYHEE